MLSNFEVSNCIPKFIQVSDETQRIACSVRKITWYVTKKNKLLHTRSNTKKKSNKYTFSCLLPSDLSPHYELHEDILNLQYRTLNPFLQLCMLILTPKQGDYRKWLRIKFHINIFHIQIFLCKTVIAKIFKVQCLPNQEIITLQN